MTQLRTRPLVRETAIYYRGRPLLIALYPGYMAIRPKGKRLAYTIDYRSAFEAGAKIAARQAAAEKGAAKLARRQR